tara:strand:- start:5311 stop:5763 length:453 start_codon:yes stop_codon:yes gene_type:complete
MTELNLAYGFTDDEEIPIEKKPTRKQPAYSQQEEVEYQKPIQYIEQPQQNINKQFNSPTSSNMSNDAPIPIYRKPMGYSFWDRLNLKRPEVIKLAMFSLVILLAISLDRVGTFYITKYITENVLTETQELLLRLSYPVIIFLILWFLKAL